MVSRRVLLSGGVASMLALSGCTGAVTGNVPVVIRNRFDESSRFQVTVSSGENDGIYFFKDRTIPAGASVKFQDAVPALRTVRVILDFTDHRPIHKRLRTGANLTGWRLVVERSPDGKYNVQP